MRSRNAAVTLADYKILAVDDDIAIIKAVKTLLKRNGYQCDGVTDPLLALEKVRTGNYDLLILDYRMEPLRGDELVTEIRKFNQEIYILFFTGHQELAPPLKTIKTLDIQGYCGKSDGFDRLLLAIESAFKSIARLRKVQNFRDGLNRILEAVPRICQTQSIEATLEEILRGILPLVNS
ncbi:MAG TPA: response regulator, partial [Bacillota bacterium]